MTGVYFSLCFQLKLMTWIPVLLLLGFKNVRTLSDFLFFLLRKKGEKKLNIVGSQRCLICLWVNEILAYWEQSKDNFFSFFYSHENYNIAFFLVIKNWSSQEIFQSHGAWALWKLSGTRFMQCNENWQLGGSATTAPSR